MSPEQVAGRTGDVDTRTDIYALGVILYQLLAGRLPHDVQDRTLPEAARIISQEPHTRLGSIHASLRGDVETIVNKALEHAKDRRYASASELAADIRRYLNNEPISARPATMLSQLRKFARRHRGLVLGFTAAAAFLVLGSITTLLAMLQARHNAQLARENELAARRTSYRLSIAAAAAVSSTNPVQARKHLEEAPKELRNWEWRYEMARLAPCTTAIDAPSTGPIGPIVAFRYDGVPLAAISRGGAIEIHDLSTGALLRTITCDGQLTNPALPPDGYRLAAWVTDVRTIGLFDTSTGTLLHRLPIPDQANLQRMVFSHDGAMLAAAGATGCSIWDTDSAQLRWRTPAEYTRAEHVAFSPDHSRTCIARRTSGGTAISVHNEIGRVLLDRGIIEDCNALAFSPDAGRIAIGSYNRIVNILDAGTLNSTARFRGHADRVTAAAFSPDGERLATSSRDGTCRVWDFAAGQPLATAATGEMHALAFSPDGASLAAGGPAGAIWWEWTASNDRILTGHTSYVYFTAFSPDGRLVASYGWDDRIRLWNAFTGECLAVESVDYRVMGLDFTADGSRLVAAQATRVLFFDSESLRPLSEPESPADVERFRIITTPYPESEDQHYWRYLRVARGGAKNTIEAEGGQRVASSLDGGRMAAGGRDGTVAVLDARAGGTIARIKAHSVKPRAVALSPDGSVLATSAEDGSILLWNVDIGEPITTLTGHVSRVYSIAFNPDGSRIVSGGNDNTILLWDSHTFEQVAALHGHASYVHAVSFSPDGTQIVSGSGDHTIRIWDALPRAQRNRR